MKLHTGSVPAQRSPHPPNVDGVTAMSSIGSPGVSATEQVSVQVATGVVSDGLVTRTTPWASPAKRIGRSADAVEIASLADDSSARSSVPSRAHAE